ncbi:hypothetical protein DW886_14745 [Enterocloster aldenensis]|uniref:hypothetical protein n=1 Tax=Enterocloster aldenensis TaxID=358742 RepID=UPI000E4E3C6E|nr:hypothetical protein DW886_14745 [Enterocloster aldenensis]
MWRFCNDDERLIKKGGRKAPCISKKEFEEKIKNYCKKDEEFLKDFDPMDSGCILSEDEYMLLSFVESIYYRQKTDRKILFDEENIEITEGIGGRLCGIHTLKNGLPILGVYAGGDWEQPLFFCIYWDGENFRIYIPRYGNTFNIVAKAAFGSESMGTKFAKYEADLKKAGKKYIEWTCQEEIGRQYCEFYGKNGDVADVINADAMEEDICSRIVIV